MRAATLVLVVMGSLLLPATTANADLSYGHYYGTGHFRLKLNFDVGSANVISNVEFSVVGRCTDGHNRKHSGSFAGEYPIVNGKFARKSRFSDHTIFRGHFEGSNYVYGNRGFRVYWSFKKGSLLVRCHTLALNYVAHKVQT